MLTQAPDSPVAGENPSRVHVSDAITNASINSIGAYFEPLCGVDRAILGRDHVDPERYRRNIEALDREMPLANRTLLEIGCGFGIGLAVMAKEFGVDAYGIEPASEGFDSSLSCARLLFDANGLDRSRVMDGVGEKLPFPDATFDIVYSNNVLEHTSDPALVLQEAFRVLKPNGTLYFEMPNYLSYYEGHYFVPQPPILWNGLLAFWVSRVFGRDPTFARTLRTEINPVWIRRTLRSIGRTHALRLHTTGERRFLARMAQPFVFQTASVQNNAGRAVRMLQRLNRFNWIGRLLVLLQAHYPIVLIATRLPE
jgi:SAM-dependent methyltransferase